MIPIPPERLQLFIDLFRQGGYRSPSMLDIAKHIGVSTKTLYRYVKNKEELILFCIAKQEEEIAQQLNEINNNDRDTKEELFHLFQLILSFHQRFSQRSTQDLSRFYPEAYQQYEKLENRLYQVLKNHLFTGRKNGQYQEQNHLQSVLYIIKSQLLELAHHTPILPALTTSEVQEEVFDLLWKMVR